MARGVFRRRWPLYASSTRRHNLARLGITSGTATISISTPVDGRIHQRSGTTGTITVTGTYTGSPATIEARLVQDGTNTPVSFFDWAVKVGSPAGGAYSFSFTSVPQGGWYNVQVRFSDATAVTATSGKVGVGALYALAGQSNAYYWFYSRSTATDPNTRLRVYGNIGTWQAASKSGMSGAIAFGNSLISTLDIPVGVLDYGVSSTSALAWVNTYGPNMVTAVNALDGKLEGVIWIQGEQDAADAVSTFLHDYRIGLVFDNWRTSFSQASLPIIICSLGRLTSGGNDTNWQNIRDAHIGKQAEANNYRVERADLALVDTVHHTAAAFETLGARCAQAAKYALGLVAYYRGPRIASATYNGSIVDVTLTHVNGTDFTPTSGITGFRVLVGWSPIAVNSAVRLSATKVRLTLASTPGSAPVVQYWYGANPTITGAVIDNGGLTLPLEGTNSTGITSTLSVPSATVTLVNESGSVQASLSSLKWAWFDQITPDLFVAPTDKGAAETTDGSGVLTIDLPNSSKTSGQVGWLIVTNSDGTTNQAPAHRAFSGPVAVN